MGQPKRLFLLRHAKSSWDEPRLADYDRPRARRGRQAAKSMARYLRNDGISPALVLCSSSRRTRDTLKLLGLDWEVRIERELYSASEDELLERLRRVPDTLETVLLVAHNPAIQKLAIRLAGRGAPLADVERKFPTGALATLTFADRWRELRPDCAELTGFATPKQLQREAG